MGHIQRKRENVPRSKGKREKGRHFRPVPTRQTNRAYARTNETNRFPRWTPPQPPISRTDCPLNALNRLHSEVGTLNSRSWTLESSSCRETIILANVQKKILKSAGPNTNQNPLASVLLFQNEQTSILGFT